MNSWERKDNESKEKYHYFSIYRDYGIGRSIARVATATGKSIKYLETLSHSHQWVLRANDFDHMVADQTLKNSIDEKVAMNKSYQNIAEVARAKLSKSLAAIKVGKNTNITQFVKALEALQKIERLAMGMSSDNVDMNVTDGNVTIEVLPVKAAND